MSWNPPAPCYSRAMIRKIRLLAWVPLASVVLMFAAVYASWAVAYGQLERRPRPSADDPKAIGGFSTDLYDFSAPLVSVLLITWAVTSLFAFAMGIREMGMRSKTMQPGRWWFGFAAGVIPIFLLIVVVRHSPGEAMEWFFD